MEKREKKQMPTDHMVLAPFQNCILRHSDTVTQCDFRDPEPGELSLNVPKSCENVHTCRYCTPTHKHSHTPIELDMHPVREITISDHLMIQACTQMTPVYTSVTRLVARSACHRVCRNHSYSAGVGGAVIQHNEEIRTTNPDNRPHQP